MGDAQFFTVDRLQPSTRWLRELLRRGDVWATGRDVGAARDAAADGGEHVEAGGDVESTGGVLLS